MCVVVSVNISTNPYSRLQHPNGRPHGVTSRAAEKLNVAIGPAGGIMRRSVRAACIVKCSVSIRRAEMLKNLSSDGVWRRITVSVAHCRDGSR